MAVQHPDHEQHVVLARGLPASGKTTWFKQVIAQSPPCYRYISRDDLRDMLVGKPWNSKRERAVIDARDTLLRRFLSEGYCVVVDETFLNPSTLNHVRGIVAEFPHVLITEKDFTDVDIDVCIERDIHRGDRAVGAGVIRSLAQKWLRPSAPLVHPLLPNAIICDLDGTLALFGEANPYNRDFSKDSPNPAVASLLHSMAARGVRIIITSGRSDDYYHETRKWLQGNDIPWDELFMREASDKTKDAHLKRGWYDANIRGRFNILFVLDDRDQVVDMWRRLGLTCFQVDYGAF